MNCNTSIIIRQRFPRLAILVAHPDDEMLFFYGLIKKIQPQEIFLIIVTGQFIVDQSIRLNAAYKSARLLKAQYYNCGFVDYIDAHLSIAELCQELKNLPLPSGTPIFTHGPFGEYGHPHHIDTFYAATRVFKDDVWFISGPFQPSFTVKLNDYEFQSKRRDFLSVYNNYKIARWLCAIENFTAMKEFKFKKLLHFRFSDYEIEKKKLFDKQLAKKFLMIANRSYIRNSQSMPIETKAIYENWKSNVVLERLRREINNWQEQMLIQDLKNCSKTISKR